MDSEKKISLAVIKRLPRYYRYLSDLIEKDIARISSKELSEKMNITASQIRQDLNNFGTFGQQGYGYNVESLQGEIKKILGLEKKYNLIIIGTGNVGQALLNYDKFIDLGFNFIGIFDTRENLVGKVIKDLKVMHINDLEEFVTYNNVDIAVLSVPKDKVNEISKSISKLNVKGIWNFSNIDLQPTNETIIENVHLTDSLMTLSYRLNE